ncbi:MAG: hypothetical protein KDB27_28915, partial [Planctomycetales bacterium]|nr:hypothetical protein [Planctomycetales bacterium]
KVLSILRQTGDPSLAAFASRNIGVGVSPSAPHFQRITALRDRYIGKQANLPNRVAEILNERGMSGDGEALELALSLAESPSTTLNAALRSLDEDLALPAAVALLQKIPQLQRSEKREALRTLRTRDLTTASEDYRSVVEDSIKSLQSALDAELQRKKSDRSRFSPPPIRQFRTDTPYSPTKSF